mmetsp:Transcript_18891/g.27943  ORF Transcript_18891/g.27943 Transcript_18891/m.27943 type:complete len:352 (-) Transcript_18891:123-1178(-)
MSNSSDIGFVTRRKLDTLDTAAEKNATRLAESSTLKSYSSIAKASLKLTIVELQTQMALLVSLGGNDDTQNGNLLFSLMDEDSSGHIATMDVVEFIESHHRDKTYWSQIQVAMETVAEKEPKLTQSGMLNKYNFRKYIARLAFELKMEFGALTEALLNTYFRARNRLEVAAEERADPVVVEEAEEPNFDNDYMTPAAPVVETVVDDEPQEDDGIFYVQEPDENGVVHYGSAEIPPPDEAEEDGIVYDTPEDDGIVYDEQEDVVSPAPFSVVSTDETPPHQNTFQKTTAMAASPSIIPEDDDDDDDGDLDTVDSLPGEPNTVIHHYQDGYIPKSGIDYNKNYGTVENPMLFV